MIGGCRIGRAARAAVLGAERRRRRIELPVPPLAARLLARAPAQRPARGVWTAQIEVRVTTAAGRAAPVVPAPSAALVPAAPLAAGTLLVRETLRERIEHTVERLLARGRRAEPEPATVRVATPDGADAAIPPPAFPPLVLAPAAPPAAAPVAAAEPRARAGGLAPAVAPAASAGAASAPPVHLPLLVDEIVGELERRNRALRERRGWLA